MIAANLLKHTLGLQSEAFLHTSKFMAAHCSSVVLMSTVAMMIRVSVYTSSLVHCETTFVWFVSAEADCRGA